ncbi:cache domain-containing protein [Aliarcobacter skirrowii]|uniref:cache domain-containing protein n=1 Tax=Aliarcobacter skirrowii TaxID=28200 RepID=UPI0029A9DB2B|nr:cache domain-containing protein [Aliarcobacter skirrowii]MDX4071695.1 cache domain-containing protein [Aliarcobacter skirrowii]
MNNNIEKNLLKTIILSFIATISALVFAISAFYVKNTQDNFELDMQKYVNVYYNDVKDMLKNKINIVIDILEHNEKVLNLRKDELKKFNANFLNNITFEKNKSNYIFVYEVVNFDGGDNFAIMLVNPNRPDLAGSLISTNEIDTHGKKFREEFLENIKKYGESFTKYSYKKPDSNEAQYKLSYFKYYEKLNWIIAVGVYIDDIEKELIKQRNELENKIEKQIFQNVLLFIMFLMIAILFSITISNKIYNILKIYKEKVIENEKELKLLNKSLEEMMSNIAHQWRQPLSELSSILMLIKLKYDKNSLDKETMQKKSKEANMVLEYMSNTIDDFRGFFSTTKEKEEFFLNELLNNVISINSNVLKMNNIDIKIDINKDIKLNSFLNEYQQVILNILKNSKDALIERDIKNPTIKIEAFEDEKSVTLTIEDNGGGIDVKPLNKIFEAYFSTKNQNKGTGIGLYMSKMIVEKSLKGEIRVENIYKGVRFSITIAKNI